MDLDPSTRNVEPKGVETNEMTPDSNIRFMENKRNGSGFTLLDNGNVLSFCYSHHVSFICFSSTLFCPDDTFLSKTDYANATGQEWFAYIDRSAFH